MNNVFTVKLLQNLQAKKKGNKGFTLIELLVVVIIIGVLAAVALPNLLGQVGKARESEAKTALGALNRSQQAYRLEAQEFFGEDAVDTFTDTPGSLGVVPGTEFYSYVNGTTAEGDPDNTTFQAATVDPKNSGARDFASGVNYTDGAFRTVLCVSTLKSDDDAGRTGEEGLTTADPSTATVADQCDAGSLIK